MIMTAARAAFVALLALTAVELAGKSSRRFGCGTIGVAVNFFPLPLRRAGLDGC